MACLGNDQVELFPALLVICSVVEPTLLKRDLPLSSKETSKDTSDADTRVPPISIGLIILQTRQGGELFFILR